MNYDQYKLSNFYNPKKSQKEPIKEKVDEKLISERPTKLKNTIKTTSNYGHIIVVLVILLSFGITFLSANFVTNGHIAKELLLSFNQEVFDNYYFVSSKAYNNYNDAYNFSLLIRQQGAGGNVLEENSKYYVLYSAYLSKNDASSVSRKIENTIVKEKKINNPKKSEHSISAYNYANRINNMRQKTIKELYEESILFVNSDTDSDIMRKVIADARNDALTLKNEIYSDNLPAKDKEFVLSKIDSLFGLTDSLLIYDDMEIGKIRYCLTQLILSY